MRLLRDNVEMKLGLSINAPARQPVEEEEEDAKLRWERKFLESRSRELELENMSTNWRTSL